MSEETKMSRFKYLIKISRIVNQIFNQNEQLLTEISKKVSFISLEEATREQSPSRISDKDTKRNKKQANKNSYFIFDKKLFKAVKIFFYSLEIFYMPNCVFLKCFSWDDGFLKILNPKRRKRDPVTFKKFNYLRFRVKHLKNSG